MKKLKTATPMERKGEGRQAGSNSSTRRLLGNDLQQTTHLRATGKNILKINGRAAVIVPDNVYFEAARYIVGLSFPTVLIPLYKVRCRFISDFFLDGKAPRVQ
jgi:hypothetical protein